MTHPTHRITRYRRVVALSVASLRVIRRRGRQKFRRFSEDLVTPRAFADPRIAYARRRKSTPRRSLARGRPCSGSRRSRQAQPGGRSAGGSEQVEAMDGRHERPATGRGRSRSCHRALSEAHKQQPLPNKPRQPDHSPEAPVVSCCRCSFLRGNSTTTSFFVSGS